MAGYAEFGRMELRGWSDPARSREYARLFSSITDQSIDALVDAVGALPGDEVLDLCCGHGGVTEALIARGCRATGLDFSAPMLELARVRVPSASFVQADAQHIPGSSERFDAVMSNFGVCHLPDPPQALAQVHRILKPGGRFAMTVWCEPARSPAFDLLYSAIRLHGTSAGDVPAAPDFHQFANADVALRLLREAGLDDVQLRVVPCAWQLEAPGDLFTAFAQATVRAAALLAALPEPQQRAVRDHMEAAVRSGFAQDGRWVVPMPAMLVSARRR